ncbi:putative HTH-type transcriptional regulator YwqM [Paenibacillus faecis]|uniref:LysR family transcriptional regulator n=1 Tax=Paenibacillus faecis TaxID=862114 RepID=UPI001B02CA56|nr:LysR family transcriptional regulator [Paenibacillus faecis]GIO88001.1 putative HTH-type transcriptional regulator YwqM [Paenibacillus faecis]
MNIQQLRILTELGNRKTLQEIAERLGLTQPTVSFHLRKLEAELGIELVHKHSRSLVLTEAAAEIMPYAKRIVALTGEMRQRIDERLKLSSHKLRLGASYTPATFFIPPFLQQFQSEHPDVQLMITVNQANKVLDLLKKFEVDAAVVSLSGDEQEEGVLIRRLMEDELKLVLSPAHPLSKLETLTVRDLTKQTFLLHEAGSTSRRLTDEWAAETGLEYGPIMELGAIETIKEAVKFNIGIGVLPERSVQREILSGELLMRSLPGYRNKRYICLAYRQEEPRSPQTRSFIKFALSRMGGKEG